MDARSGTALPRAGHRARTEPARSPSTPQTGATLYAHNSTALAPSGLGREARGLVHRPPRPRPALPLPNGARRRRVAIGPRLARQPRPRRLRRSDAHARGSRPARAPSSRDTGIRRVQGRVFGDDTHFDSRRDALGWKPSYLGIESRAALRALGRRTSPFAGANGSAAAAASAFTEALERAASPSPDAPGRDELPPMRSRSPSTSPQRLANVVPRMNARLGQLRRRDGAEGPRRDGRGAAARPPRARGSCARRCATPACGSPAFASRTARGSRASTASPRARSRSILRARRSPTRDPGSVFVASLAVAGVSGTLKRASRHAADPRTHPSRRRGRRTAHRRSPASSAAATCSRSCRTAPPSRTGRRAPRRTAS